MPLSRWTTEPQSNASAQYQLTLPPDLSPLQDRKRGPLLRMRRQVLLHRIHSRPSPVPFGSPLPPLPLPVVPPPPAPIPLNWLPPLPMVPSPAPSTGLSAARIALQMLGRATMWAFVVTLPGDTVIATTAAYPKRQRWTLIQRTIGKYLLCGGGTFTDSNIETTLNIVHRQASPTTKRIRASEEKAIAWRYAGYRAIASGDIDWLTNLNAVVPPLSAWAESMYYFCCPGEGSTSPPASHTSHLLRLETTRKYLGKAILREQSIPDDYALTDPHEGLIQRFRSIDWRWRRSSILDKQWTLLPPSPSWPGSTLTESGPGNDRTEDRTSTPWPPAITAVSPCHWSDGQ